MTFLKSFDNTKIWYNYIKGKKKCLVFLHGLTGSSSAWIPIYTYFQKKGYSILLMDLRGHGLSDKLKNLTMLNMEKDLSLLISKLKIKNFILIGHCYGGIVSQLYFRNNPGRVKKMILIDSPYNFKEDKLRYIMLKIVYAFYFFLSLLTFPFFRNVKVHLDYTQFRPSPDFQLRRIYNDVRASSFSTILPLLRDTPKYDLTGDLKKISVPVLIIHGKKDHIVGVETARNMHRLIPKSRLIELDAAHLPVVNMPEILVKKIESFL